MPDLTRRTLLRSAAGGAVGAAATAAVGSASAQTEVDYGGWFSNVSNFDGTVDRRGQDTVEVTVGAAGNNGNFAFGPAAVMVSPGTTVVWQWNGKGGAHNVVAQEGPFDSGDAVESSDLTFEYTFENEGTYKYLCEPHEGLGMKGAVAVRPGGGGGGGDSGQQGPPADPDYGDWFSNVSNFDGTVDRTGQDSVSVIVGAAGNNGNFAFGPAAVRVSPGTTVTWEWNGKGGAHNVVAQEGPFDSGDAVESSDLTFEYTFEETGIYRYLCEPHEGLGMKGAVVVGGPPGGGGGQQEERPEITPGLGLTGGALLAAFFSPLAFAAFLWRKRKLGEGHPPVERGADAGGEPAPSEPVEEAPRADLESELDHDEYDPWGTASLIAVYFAILVLLWVFMYFVEFLGRVSVIG